MSSIRNEGHRPNKSFRLVSAVIVVSSFTAVLGASAISSTAGAATQVVECPASSGYTVTSTGLETLGIGTPSWLQNTNYPGNEQLAVSTSYSGSDQNTISGTVTVGASGLFVSVSASAGYSISDTWTTSYGTTVTAEVPEHDYGVVQTAIAYDAIGGYQWDIPASSIANSSESCPTTKTHVATFLAQYPITTIGPGAKSGIFSTPVPNWAQA